MNMRNTRKGMLLGWQIMVATLMFQGHTNEEIIDIVWPGTEGTKRKYKQRVLADLVSKEEFQDYYRKKINAWSMHNVGPALNKIAEQMRCDEKDDSLKAKWMANKAANDILMYSKGVITGADDNTMVVKIEGMPELGTPEE
jgi:hypothetical protein